MKKLAFALLFVVMLGIGSGVAQDGSVMEFKHKRNNVYAFQMGNVYITAECSSTIVYIDGKEYKDNSSCGVMSIPGDTALPLPLPPNEVVYNTTYYTVNSGEMSLAWFKNKNSSRMDFYHVLSMEKGDGGHYGKPRQ
jgi:hypothetical protein